MPDNSHPLPPAAIVIRSKVADFDKWLVTFNSFEEIRRSAGFLGHHINRVENDPNDMILYMPTTDLEKAKAFAAAPELRERMKESGIIGAPDISFVTPVREAIVWDRNLPAFLLSHTVADFDHWLEGYDGAAALQAAGGIIGHAANRSIENPSVAVVYHQAESFDTLRKFLANDELKAAMQTAGVTSAPEVQFVTGGWAKQYS